MWLVPAVQGGGKGKGDEQNNVKCKRGLVL